MRNALNPTLDQSECPSVILRTTCSQKNGGAFNTICVCVVCVCVYAPVKDGCFSFLRHFGLEAG